MRDQVKVLVESYPSACCKAATTPLGARCGRGSPGLGSRDHNHTSSQKTTMAWSNISLLSLQILLRMLTLHDLQFGVSVPAGGAGPASFFGGLALGRGPSVEALFNTKLFLHEC